MELEFMSNPFTKSNVLPARLTIFCSIPAYVLYRIHMIVRTQRTISELLSGCGIYPYLMLKKINRR
jgi:hypothetical protein